MADGNIPVAAATLDWNHWETDIKSLNAPFDIILAADVVQLVLFVIH